jgi:hypothetical protein
LQYDAGFQALLEEVVVRGGAVGGGVALSGGNWVAADVFGLFLSGLWWGIASHYFVTTWAE